MIDKRKEKSYKSILLLRDLLDNVCENPGKYTEDVQLRESLKSQGRLAKYYNEDLDIRASSINTFKRVTDEFIDGGFKALDNLRKIALERLLALDKRVKKSNKKTRYGLAMRVEELEAEKLHLEKANYFLIQAVTEAIVDIKSVAVVESDDARKKRSNEAVKKLVTMLTVRTVALTQDPVTTNVIHFSQKS